MNLRTALGLGRVSNLPTVWTDVLAALALAGAPLAHASTMGLVVALSCFYLGGMYLNDAFDAPRDARERPERPIPSGRVRRGTVSAIGTGGLLLGTVLLAAVAGTAGHAPGRAALAGAALALAILVYDAWHKTNPLSPVFMGLNRLLVYVAAAVAATGSAGWPVLAGGALLLCYVVGLTYAAKQEHLDRVGRLWPLAFLAVPFVAGLAAGTPSPAFYVLLAAFLAWVAHAVSLLLCPQPPVGRAVVSLIAGIALFDASVLTSTGQFVWAALACLAFLLTLALQRWVPGT